MIFYKDLSGDSGVSAYKATDTSIIIRFKEDGTYLYDYAKPGKSHVQRMIRLAHAGKGLATYINQHVRNQYARKIR